MYPLSLCVYRAIYYRCVCVSVLVCFLTTSQASYDTRSLTRDDEEVAIFGGRRIDRSIDVDDDDGETQHDGP